MDADTILQIKPALTQYLHEFDGCMGRVTNRGHLRTYVSGQLSDLQRKSIEPMADAAGQSPRTLQEFLGLLRWDGGAMRDVVQRRVAEVHAHPHSVGIIDETSFHKQGNKTACVQRQHCGSRGKRDNCVVSVHLGYAADNFHALLDGTLYLPEETWHQDRERCDAAGIPEDVVYRAKWEIALEQVQRALGNGVRFAWLTFDEGYGGKPPFLRALDALGQNYVAEIPVSFVGWSKPPEVMHREHCRDKEQGRPRKLPRLKVRNTPACEVRNLLTCSPRLRKTPWEKFRVKDGEKGPMVWEAKCVPFWIKDENGLPSRPHRLLIARSVLHPQEIKFFLSNAPESVAVETLLLVAFSRWRIERMFEDSKDELGLDHFEVRKYGAIQRHLILTCVSHLFLVEFRLRHGEKKRPVDRRPAANRDQDVGAALGSWGTVFSATGGSDRRAIDLNPGAKRRGPALTSKTNTAGITPNRHRTAKHPHVSLAERIAL
jgi:SRSO17 transposase